MKKIITIPIKPQTNPKTGLFLTPLFLETVSNLNEGKSVLMLNLLHSFKDYSIHKHNYIKALEQANFKFDEISSDIEQLDKYKQIILSMYKQGLIKKTKRQVNKCHCGKVEIADDLMAYIANKKMINQNDNNMICSICNSQLKKIETTSLDLICKNVLNSKLDIFPRFLEKRIFSGYKDFNNTTLNISKIRDTGVSIDLDGENFNIDIDFLLYLTPQLFEDDEIILVCCNRHELHVLLTNYINDIFGHKKLQFVEHPYIISKHPEDSYDLLMQNSDKNLIKASLLNSISFNNMNSTWNEGKFLYLKKNTEVLENILSFEQPKGMSLDEKLMNYCLVIDRIRELKRKQYEENQNQITCKEK